MHPEIINYLQKERVGVIGIAMPDGAPHGATVHFAWNENTQEFYFQTFRDSKKAQGFIDGKIAHATFVLGTDESTMRTMQLDGTVALLDPQAKATCEAIYLGKFPEKSERAKDPKAVFFVFKPTWWRYSDFKRPEGKLILTSQ